ncbi:MAG TPA: hypothetical protein VGJ28_07895 [Micromonosporaceae bacterium]|jgi:hypothetical protein
MTLSEAVSRTGRLERRLAAAFRGVAADHTAEPDVTQLCERFATQCDEAVDGLDLAVDSAASDQDVALAGDLLRDLEILLVDASRVEINWVMVVQAAAAVRDTLLHEIATAAQTTTAAQIAWLRTRVSQAAAQALTVTPL